MSKKKNRSQTRSQARSQTSSSQPQSSSQSKPHQTQSSTPISTSTTLPQSSSLGNFCIQALRVLFILLLALTPFIFTWFNEELFEFNKMVFVYGLTIFIGAFWILRIVFDRRLYFRRTPLDIPLLLFFLSQLISTILSIHPRTSVFGYYTRFNSALLPTFCYIFLFYAFISNLTKKDLPKIFTWTFLSATLISLYGILEHFGFSPSCFIINFKNYLQGKATVTSTFGVSCWVQLVQERVFASFGQPNWLATYCVTLIPLGMSLTFINHYQKAKNIAYTSKHTFLSLSSKQNFLILLSTILLFTVLLFTKSRSGFLAIVIALTLITLSLFFIYRRQNLRSAWLKPALQFTISFAILSLIFGTPYTPSLQKIWQNLTPSVSAQPQDQLTTTDRAKLEVKEIVSGGTDSGEIRKIVWRGAFDIWKRYPLFGSGVETFGYSYYQDRPAEHNLTSEWDFLYNKAHNEFLNYLSTTGLVGLATYLLFLGIFSWLALKTILNLNHSESSPSARLYATGLLSALAGMMVANFFGFSTVYSNVLLFLLFGFYFLLFPDQKIFSKSKQENLSLISPPRSFSFSIINQYLTLGVTLFIATALFIQLGNFWTADWHYAKAKTLIRQSASGSGSVSDAINHFEKAITLSPQEAVFQSELADIYSQIAVSFHKKNDSQQANHYLTLAQNTIEHVIELNPVHLNFYKTALRIYLNLAQIDLAYLDLVEPLLLHAIELAPTDAKLRYNLAIVYFNTNQNNLGMQTLEYLLNYLRPNYHEARYFYAQRLEEKGDYEEAKIHHQYVLDWIAPTDQRSTQALIRLDSLIATSSSEINPE